MFNVMARVEGKLLWRPFGAIDEAKQVVDPLQH